MCNWSSVNIHPENPRHRHTVARLLCSRKNAWKYLLMLTSHWNVLEFQRSHPCGQNVGVTSLRRACCRSPRVWAAWFFSAMKRSKRKEAKRSTPRGSKVSNMKHTTCAEIATTVWEPWKHLLGECRLVRQGNLYIIKGILSLMYATNLCAKEVRWISIHLVFWMDWYVYIWAVCTTALKLTSVGQGDCWSVATKWPVRPLQINCCFSSPLCQKLHVDQKWRLMSLPYCTL